MRLALLTAGAACALALSACNTETTETTEDSVAAENVATEASATASGTAPAAYGAPTVSDMSEGTSGYGADSPPSNGPSQETRDNAKTEAEQTNLRPRPDVTGAPR